MKTETPNGFTIELLGDGYAPRRLYVYSPMGYCVLSKQYEWWQFSLAQAEFDGLVALGSIGHNQNGQVAA